MGFQGLLFQIVTKFSLSLFWTELFKLQGTTLKRGRAYQPQTDGQTEVVNRCIETYLRCFASNKQGQWAKWLAWSEYWYNTTFHSSTHFQILYGRHPPPLIRYGQGLAALAPVERSLEELSFHLNQAQQKMKATADAK